MLSIGEVPHVTGVSRRMLRHWEEVGLLVPASTDEASARLTEVRRRLDAIERGHRTIMNALELGGLPDIRLASLQVSVGDESEIGNAVSQLLPRLRGHLQDRGHANVDLVLTYDGTDESSIVVTAGTAIPDEAATASDLTTVDVAGSERGVTVRFDTPPADIGDAWISLDANLEEQDLETTGVYRQTLTPGGGVILQAPVRDRPRST